MGTARVNISKQSEKAMLKADALQSAIFNSANFSSIATDAKGVIQIFNVGAERMLGYTAAEVMNKLTPADISDPQELVARAKELSAKLETPITPGFEALVFKASRGIEDIYELTYIRKDGSRFPAVVSVTALRDEQDAIIGYLLIGTDNTARKQAEVALVKAGALQNAIFNSANFSSIATDAKGVIQIFNVGAERMLGYTAAEVMNKLTPADLSDPQELLARANALSTELGTPIAPGFEALVFKASRGIEDIYELTKIRKDGSRFPAMVSITALRDAQDAIIGYLLIGTDNTARKQIEAERQQLGQRLQEKNCELEAANKELESFAYSISHDLRAPLRAIDGFSRKMVINYGERLDDEGRRLLQVVRNNAQRMGQLIDNLLAFSRMGRREIVSQPLDMDAMVNGVADELRAAEPERSIEFAFSPLPRARGDADMMRQVWVNLLSNAVKFTRRRQTAHIEVGGCAEGGGLHYWVKDNGAGFDMQYADKLFGVFQRLHRQDEFEGVGVGLAIVQRILHRHNGRIWGEGIPDVGAAFHFALPLPAPSGQLSGGNAQ